MSAVGVLKRPPHGFAVPFGNAAAARLLGARFLDEDVFTLLAGTLLLRVDVS